MKSDRGWRKSKTKIRARQKDGEKIDFVQGEKFKTIFVQRRKKFVHHKEATKEIRARRNFPTPPPIRFVMGDL